MGDNLTAFTSDVVFNQITLLYLRTENVQKSDPTKIPGAKTQIRI